jgi:dolichyl-phosphate beta-glucosyltransferase
MAKPLLSIIIPAHNESERIPHTLLDIDKKMAERGYAYEILVIENGSKDNTAEVVEKMAATVKHLTLVRAGNLGNKGAAVKQGMLMAQGKYRVFMDADNATSIDHFDRMLPEFENGAGVVICSRAHKDTKLDPPEPWYRQIPGKIGNLIIQILVLPGIWDTQCGFKAFTAEATEKIFRLQQIRGWGFDVEILALAQRLGFKIREVPVHWVNDTRSTVGASAYITTLEDVVKIRWSLLTGKYDFKSVENITVTD